MGLYAQNATPLSFREESSGGGGLFGLLGNLWNEGEDLIGGLVKLGGVGLSDLRRAAMEAATLGHYDPTGPDTGYQTQHILAKLPEAFLTDIEQRWGPALDMFNPFDDESWWDNYQQFANQLYEHPLSAFLDVAGLAGAGASVANRVGRAAIKGSEVAEAAFGKSLSELTTGMDFTKAGMSGEQLQQFIRDLPNVATKPHRAYPTATREGLEALATERPLNALEELSRRILPRQSTRLRGSAPVVKGASEWGMPTVGQLVPYAKRANPVVRPLEELVRRTFTMSPGKYAERVEQLAKSIEDTQMLGETVDPAKIADLARARSIAEEASRLGVRLDRPTVAKATLFRAASDWYSGTSAMHLLHRQKDMEKVIDVIKPWMERYPNLRETGFAFLNRLEKKLPGEEGIDPMLEGTLVKWPDLDPLSDEPGLEWFDESQPLSPGQRSSDVRQALDAMNLVPGLQQTKYAVEDLLIATEEIATKGTKIAREHGYTYEKVSSALVQLRKYADEAQALPPEITTMLEGLRDQLLESKTTSLGATVVHAATAAAQGDVSEAIDVLQRVLGQLNPEVLLPGYQAGMPRRMFHGTATPFEQFDEEFQDPESLFGPGFYHTDDPHVASSYSQGGRNLGLPQEQVFDTDLEARRGALRLHKQGYLLEDSAPLQTPEGKFIVRYRERPPSHVRGSYMNIKNPLRPDEKLTPDVYAAINAAVDDYIDGLPNGIRADLREDWDQRVNGLVMEDDPANGLVADTVETMYRELDDFTDRIDSYMANELDLMPIWQDQVLQEALKVVESELPDSVVDDLVARWNEMTGEDAEYLKEQGLHALTPGEVLDTDVVQFIEWVEEALAEPPDINVSPSLDDAPTHPVVTKLEEAMTAAMKDALPRHHSFTTRSILEKAGFDGIMHRGGLRVGNVEHDVAIAWHPEQIKPGLALPIQLGKAPDPEAWFERVASSAIDKSEFLPPVGPHRARKPLMLVLPDAIREALKDNPRLMQLDSFLGDLSQMIQDGRIGEADMQFVPELIDLINRMGERAFRHQQGKLPMDDEFLDDIRVNLTMQDALDAVESGQMTIEQMLERPTRAFRMKYGAKPVRKRIDEFAADGTPTGKYHYEVVYEGGPDWQDVYEMFRQADAAPPVYFPFISSQRKRLSDYFRATRNVGYADASADPHFKFMEGTLLRKGDFVRDPMEAYARRAARGVRAEETLGTMLKMVQTFGRPIERADQLGSNEVLIAPRYLFMKHNIQRMFEDGVDELIDAGHDPQAAIPRVLDQIIRDTQDEIMDLADTGDVEMYAVPRVVADRLTDAQRFAGFGGKWASFVDAPMRMWRNIVLLGRPAWVLNNLLGNVVFAKMQGASVMDAMRLLENRYARLLNERFGLKLPTKFLDELERLPGSGNVGSGFFSTLGQFEPRNPIFEQSKLGQAINQAAQNRPMRALTRYGEFIKTVNRELESAFRDASYLSSLERQTGLTATKQVFRSFMSSRKRIDDVLKDGIALGTNETPGAATKLALAEVNNFFGDYTRLSPFERHIVRRFIFPWWGFYRHQLRLLTSFPMNYPGRARIMQTAALATMDMMQAYGPVPEWLEGSVPLGPPGVGEIPFLSTRGGNPFEGTFQPWTSQVSPLLKVAYEQATGRNSFTQDPFTDRNVITPFGGEPQRIVYDENGFPVDVEPAGKTAPGIIEHLLQQLPQYNAIKQAFAGGRTYDTASMMDALMDWVGQGHNATRTSSTTGQPLFPTDALEQLSRMLGFNMTDYDLSQYQLGLAEQQSQALREALQRMALQG